MSQLSQFWHMLATLPSKHLKKANVNVTGDILVAFREGHGHRIDLRLKPLEEVE
jgi:hypothetical protein